jgi:hypothetical protein|tara:strand:+ start:1618 stop:1917 length:300 start_codon:yes stop_codon:yes gene_type:complete
LNAIIYDEASFREVDKFTVPVMEGSNEDEDLEILYMVASQDDQRIGMSVGRQLIKDQEEITEIIVYKYNRSTEKFEVERARENQFKDACIQFVFDVQNP